MAAGSAINQLARDYANLPVVFLEEDIDNAPFDRYYRWWDSYGGNSATLPLVMVNSGHRVSNGPLDYYNTYKAMIDSELQRPTAASIEAYFRRIGDHIRVYGSLTNLSGATLWYTNSASIGAIVYENALIHLTDRFVRATAQTYVHNPLLPGATMTFTLDTPDSTISNALTLGWQTGQIEFSASSGDGLVFTQIVPVSAYHGTVQRTFLPVVMH